MQLCCATPYTLHSSSQRLLMLDHGLPGSFCAIVQHNNDRASHLALLRLLCGFPTGS